jgi:hypothetical protein
MLMEFVQNVQLKEKLNMKQITPNEIYSLFHKETNLAKGVHVRPVKNFEHAHASKDWNYFVSCANLINRNNGHIDPYLYIKALAQYFKGWFNPSFLTSRQSISIYKDYLLTLEQDITPQLINEEISRSIKFIVKFCLENNLSEFCDYLSHDLYLIPTILKHISAGSVSFYALACINNFSILLQSYPPDTIQDYLPNYSERVNLFRSRIIYNKLNYDVENIINEMLKRLRKEEKDNKTLENNQNNESNT